MKKLDNLFLQMIKWDAGNAELIQHFTKVHSYARLIGLGEGLDEKTQTILEAAAYVHDIGIKEGIEKYGRDDGPLQEKLGPPSARILLEKVGYSKDIIERVSFLVGHHHTYNSIEGKDYQILVEADFLVNLFERRSDNNEIKSVRERIFKTKTGLEIFDSMFQE